MKNQTMGVNKTGKTYKIQQWLQKSGGVTLTA